MLDKSDSYKLGIKDYYDCKENPSLIEVRENSTLYESWSDGYQFAMDEHEQCIDDYNESGY